VKEGKELPADLSFIKDDESLEIWKDSEGVLRYRAKSSVDPKRRKLFLQAMLKMAREDLCKIRVQETVRKDQIEKYEKEIEEIDKGSNGS
jgi:hypothetical protein